MLKSLVKCMTMLCRVILLDENSAQIQSQELLAWNVSLTFRATKHLKQPSPKQVMHGFQLVLPKPLRDPGNQCPLISPSEPHKFCETHFCSEPYSEPFQAPVTRVAQCTPLANNIIQIITFFSECFWCISLVANKILYTIVGASMVANHILVLVSYFGSNPYFGSIIWQQLTLIAFFDKCFGCKIVLVANKILPTIKFYFGSMYGCIFQVKYVKYCLQHVVVVFSQLIISSCPPLVLFHYFWKKQFKRQ